MKKNETKSSGFSLRLHTSTLADWKRRAAQEGRSLASWITRIVEAHKSKGAE